MTVEKLANDVRLLAFEFGAFRLQRQGERPSRKWILRELGLDDHRPQCLKPRESSRGRLGTPKLVLATDRLMFRLLGQLDIPEGAQVIQIATARAGSMVPEDGSGDERSRSGR